MARKIGRVHTFFGSLSMRVKINLALLFTIIAVLLLGEVIYESRYRIDETKNITAYYEAVTQNYVKTMESLMDKMVSASSFPLYVKEIKDVLRFEKFPTEDIKRTMSFTMRVIDERNQAYEYGIALYGKTGKVYYSWIRPKFSNVVLDNFDVWMKTAEEFMGATCFSKYDDGTGEFALAALKVIRMPSTLETIGLMAIVVPRDVIAGAGGESGTSANIAVYDSFGEMVYTNSHEPVPQKLVSMMRNRKMGESGTIRTDEYLGYCFSHNQGKYSIIVYDETDDVFYAICRAGNMFRLSAVLIGAIAIVCASLFSRKLTQPLSRLTTLMHRVQSGDRSVRFHARYRDEVGLLADSFDHMLDQLDEMVKKVVETETVRKQTEIDALKGQIAPHFMYNCLENFQMMAVEDDNFELAGLIGRFGKLIRYNISGMNENTTLKSEIEYLKLYVDIQNSRRVKPVLMNVFMPGELSDTGIIKLALQPVVENAFHHAFEGDEENDPRIDLTVSKEENACVIRISDNGIGMTEERLNEIRRQMQTDYMRSDTASIGLRNANTRIKLYYGEMWGITVESGLNAGSVITVRIPAGKEEK